MPVGFPKMIRVGWAVLAILWAPLPAAGQEQVPDTVPLLDADTLVVRILRSPVPLDNSSHAISTAGTDDLRTGKAGVSLEEAVQALPGIQIQNRYNYSTGERVAIRGLGARSQFGIRGLKVLVDRIPATLPDGQSTLDHLDLASLGRLEVLRGPAASLYGNASGGVLSFTTALPPLVPFRPEATAATGTDGLLRIQGSAAGVGGSTSYLASVSYLGYDGFRTDPTDPDGAPYSRAERLNANAHLSWSTWGGDLGLTVNFVDLDAENPGSVNDSVLALGDRPAHGFNVIQQTRKEMRQAQAGLSWEGPIGGLRGEATVYGITRTLDNPIPPRVIDLDRLAGGLRATVGSTSGTDAGPGWLVGTDLELQHDDRLNFENDRGERGEVTLDQLETVRGVGLFGRGMIGLGQRGRLIAGLRYDRSSFEADDRMPGRFPGESIEDASGSRTMDQLSPSLGVSFSPRPDHSVFANVSSLFGTPTTTELANQADGSRGFNPDLEPQTGWALEAGARGHLGDTGGYEVALFRTELNDELIPFESVEQPGRTFFKNAGSSRYQGFEAALFGQLGSVFDGRLTYTYTSAEFVEYIVDGTDLAGNRIPGQAPHRLEGVVRGEQGRGFAELRLLYMDEIPANDANTAASESYGLVDLRAGLRELDLGRLVVSPFAGVTNLFDQTYVASVVVNAFGGRFFEPGPSRGVYVGLSAAWPGT